MKSLCTKLLITFALTSALTIPLAQAGIPFDQAEGMLDNTQDDKKHLSPFWAMVAVHGKMLENIRFMGNYTTVPSMQPEEGNARAVDQGKDSITRLIKALFNSPDGIQFVATTYENTAVGNLSRNLDKVNDIIEILEMGHVYKPSQDYLTALDNRDLKLNYDKLTAEMREIADEKVKLQQRMKINRKNMGVIHGLKPRRQAEIEALNKEYSEITNALKSLKVQLENKGTTRVFIEPLLDIWRASEPAHERILKVLNADLELIEDETVRDKIKADNNQFTTLLLKAYDAQKTYANPKQNPDQYLYPENIVITTLLSFFVKVADDASELEKLPFLMKKEIKKSTDFDAKDYYMFKEACEANDGSLKLPSILEEQELAFLMAQGFDAYENVFAKPVNYDGSTPYGNTTFPNCGETSLMNVLWIFLSAGKGGIITPEVLRELQENLQQYNPNMQLDKMTPNARMIQFFEKNPDMSKATIKSIHQHWTEIVSNLNGDQPPVTLNDVRYGCSIGDSPINIYEIKSNVDPDVKGIVNMFNVIAKLIPDSILNDPWSDEQPKRLEQVGKKLTRLCELLSREGLSLSWERTKITNEFAHIIFKNNNSPVFSWRFESGHFQLDPLTTSTNDWRSAYKTVNEGEFQNEWMAALYLKLNEDKFVENENYGKKYPLSLIYSPDLRSLDGAIKAISFILWNNINHKSMMHFQPLMARWIDKSIPLNDGHSLENIAHLFYEAKHSDGVKNILANPKYKILQDEVTKLGSSNPLQTAANKGWKTALYLICQKPGANKILDLTKNKNITNEDFGNLTNLNTLILRDGNNYSMNDITDAGLTKLTNLDTLDLSKNFLITDNGLVKDGKAIHPFLTTLNLSSNNRISNNALAKLTTITTLDLRGNYTISDTGLVKDGKAIHPFLTTLNLNSNNRISDDSLTKLMTLITLDLSNNFTIRDDALAKLTTLTTLDLSNNSTIRDAGLEKLTNLQSLILIGSSRITNEGLAKLTNLTTLDLRSKAMKSTLTAAGLIKDGKAIHERLTTLDLSAIRWQDRKQTIKFLKENNPNLKIIEKES